MTCLARASLDLGIVAGAQAGAGLYNGTTVLMKRAVDHLPPLPITLSKNTPREASSNDAVRFFGLVGIIGVLIADKLASRGERGI